MIRILIVNINNLSYTQNLIEDVLCQTYPYKLRIVDQGSSEIGTKEYLNFLKEFPNIEVMRNDCSMDLSKIWNLFYANSTESYLCFLNNDVRISRNFVKDTVSVLDKEPTVGCVVHTTNHPNYQKETPLEYVIMQDKFVQGWDFTMRKEVYTLIPDDIKTYGGDDYLYDHLYKNGWKVAVVLSSPVIHFKAKSRQFYRRSGKDLIAFTKYECKRLSYENEYSRGFPTFERINNA